VDRIALRAPGRSLPLATLLERLIVGADEALCDQLIRRDAVRCAGRRLRAGRREVPAGVRVELDPTGLELLAEPDLRADEFEVLVASPAWHCGRLVPRSGPEIEYRVLETRGGVSALRLSAPAERAAHVLAVLAQSGWPVLGDGRRGGVLVEGGARIRIAGAGPAPGPCGAQTWWPGEPVFAVWPDDDKVQPDWRVSRATARALERGHPWILPDAESDDPERLAPGTCVKLVDPQGRELGVARLEGAGPVAARLWSPPSGDVGEGAISVEARVANAIARRRPLLRRGSARLQHRGRPHTDAIRLVHAEADGLPGLALDRLGPLLRVLVSGRACAGLVDRVVEATVTELGDAIGSSPPVIEVLHLRASPPGRHVCVRVARQGKAGPELDALTAGEGLVVYDRGLRFRVDPGLGEPERPRPGFGLYLDQRENRERLGRLARSGGRWLNLFAHTGAFSVALLAAGAEEVTSVDLSGAYLRWLESNLELNAEFGVDAARHHSVRRDGRRHLGSLARGERFDGIVLDPPTAAAAGRRFWSAGRDLEPLIGEALTRLVPGGVLLVCRNERRAKRRLHDLVQRAAERTGVRVGPLREAGPGADFPHRPGFPEGDSFQGAIVQRS